ncbi:MAG: hypothetical protein QF574_02195, partial [Arenicellales bacterium]|nr:hypothetical protein [Arenicellales bacterium]
VGVVLQLSGVVIGVGLHVEVAVAAQVKQNRPGLAFFFTLQGLGDGARNSPTGPTSGSRSPR